MSVSTNKILTGDDPILSSHKKTRRQNPLTSLSVLGNVQLSPDVKNYRGKPVKLDALLEKENEKYGVIWLNWKRKVGTNKIHQAERLVKDTGLSGAIIIGPAFSDTAEELARKITASGKAKVILIEDYIFKDIDQYGE